MKGKIKGQEVMVLIDSGASSNFIARRVVEDLQVHISLIYGRGGKLPAKGRQKSLQECHFKSAKNRNRLRRS